MTTKATFDVLACRTYLGITQTQLGVALGVTKRQVRRWETGAQPRKNYVLAMRELMRKRGDAPPTIQEKEKAASGPRLSLSLLPSSFSL